MSIHLTATLGVPGSASTWVFNVARELILLRRPRESVESFYSDAVDRAWPVFRRHRHLDRSVIWKLHEPNATWRLFLAKNDVALILSVRDPRDAMLSMMDRFGNRKDHVFDRVDLAYRSVMDSMAHDHLALRYEDGFFNRPDTVGTVAGHVGVAASESEQADIYTAYRTETVRAFAENLDGLPRGRVRTLDSTQYDEVTQIHRSHIGDQQVGKWRERFGPDERADLTAKFSPYLKAFGYEID